MRRHALVWWSGQIRRPNGNRVNVTAVVQCAMRAGAPRDAPYNRPMTSRSAVRRPPATLLAAALGFARAGLVVGAVLAVSPIAHAAPADLRIEQPHAREAPPGARTAVVYLVIDNRGATPDRLLRASSPRAAAVELHTMRMDAGVMRMRAVADVRIPARGRVELAPGGLHLMLVDPAPPLRAGERVPLTLTFEHAGAVAVDVEVDPLKGATPHGTH